MLATILLLLGLFEIYHKYRHNYGRSRNNNIPKNILQIGHSTSLQKRKRYCSLHPVVFVTFTILLFFKGKKMLLVRCITDDIIDILCVILIKGCKHTQMRWKTGDYEIA